MIEGKYHLKVNTPGSENGDNTGLLFSQLWDISVDGMRLTDENGIILMVNESFCKIVGLPSGKLIGNLFSDVYMETEQEKALQTYLSDIKNNQLKTHFERKTVLWNGRLAWFEFSNSILHLDENRKLTLSIIKDITGRKNSEEELRLSEMKYRMLFNNANDAVFVTQLIPGKTYGDFIEVNDIACRRLGYTKEEFLKLSPSAIVSPVYINTFNLNSEKLMHEGHVVYDIEHRAKDRKLIPVEVNSHLFLFNNHLTILSIARDITERKQSEEKLKSTTRSLRDLASHLQTIREEERGMIAREIHDELGQVLTVLKIQISLLSNKLNKNQQELKNRINELSDVIDKSIESVQKISAKLRPGILDELGLAAAIEWQAQDFESRTNIKFSLTLPANEIDLDQKKATALFRIFQEAVTNSARHSGGDRISVSLIPDEGKLTLEIRDNGRGITPNEIKDANSLGLLGMKERAMILGGEVSIEGFPGRGSIVKVIIPNQN